MATLHVSKVQGRRTSHLAPNGLILSGLFLTVAAVGAQTYQLVAGFRNQGQPQAGLVLATDGNLYGTTYFGGSSGIGTIFRVDSFGHFITVHSFAYADGANPAAALIQGSDGALYGTAARGGANNLGVVFKMKLSGEVAPLHSFAGADGATPIASLVEGSDGSFYGTASQGGASDRGTIFRIDTSGAFAVLYDFANGSGSKPGAALMQTVNGDFFGSTMEGGGLGYGTLFRMDATGSVTILRSLALEDGVSPRGGLVQGSDSYLYGTASAGGAYGRGTIFRLVPPGSFEKLHDFQFSGGGVATVESQEGGNPLAALIQLADDYLYGTTNQGGDSSTNTDGWGTIFRISPAGKFETLYWFAGPDGGSAKSTLVVGGDGAFYGTTSVSGNYYENNGTIFRFGGSDELTTLHEFPPPDGEYPLPLIQASDGNFYGMTYSGGDKTQGTIFRLTASGDLRTIHSFDGIEGRGPEAALLEANDGYLYGATLTGGKNGGGAIFRADFSGNVTLVHEFGGPDGLGPASALIQASDGYLYGTAYNGGDTDDGTIFRMGFFGQWQTLHVFEGTDGAAPAAALLEASDGEFYGTTWGPFYHGTVFRISVDGEFESLHTFNGYDGVYPTSALVQAEDGNFYGTTSSGGGGGHGTIFRIDTAGELDTLISFTGGMDGGTPGGLVEATDGNLYGIASLGGFDDGLSGYGTAFRTGTAGGLATIHYFQPLGGTWPRGKLTEASDGSLYGVTNGGGPFGGPGVIFRLSANAIAVNAVIPTSGPAAGGGALELLGGGFSPDATVTIGGTTGTDVTVADPTFLYLFTPALSPGTLNDVSVTIPEQTLGASTGTHPNAFFADFLDVPQLDPFHDYVETIFRKGVTAGCGPGNYCPLGSVTREQMAVFLLRSKHGAAYAPPPCTGVFGDVRCPSTFADWIEQLAKEGITAGCGGGNYCPVNPVTRAQMAAFLLKAEHGSSYVPPACGSFFLDVACPSLFANWIEQLAAEKITTGCGGGNYCPANPNTRAQMSAFLVKTFAF